MPIFRLSDELVFPPVELAEPDGLLAVGADLGAERLLLAYSSGIFPWYMPDEPILWWSPDPRMVLYPAELKISKSMAQVLRGNRFTVTFDKDFEAVIRACATTERDGSTDTWIVPEMIAAYTKLNELGHAHSVEVWRNNVLVGGLYGVMMGRIFCGESMFSRESNASKAGFISLVRRLQELGLYMVDCQTHTPHLESLGGRLIPRKQFLAELTEQQQKAMLGDAWQQG